MFMKKQKKQIELSKVDKASATMLDVIYHGTIALYYVSVTDAEKSPVGINYHYESILTLGEEMVDKSEGAQRSRGLSFETGLVPPLWLLVLNCDNTSMRESGLILMKRWHRREGVWDGQKVADVVEKVQSGGLHAVILRNPWLAE